VLEAAVSLLENYEPESPERIALKKIIERANENLARGQSAMILFPGQKILLFEAYKKMVPIEDRNQS